MKDCNCIFCKIANGEIPSPAAYEDDEFKVILDLGPASKGHALVLPKDHYENIAAAPAEVVGKAFAIAAKVGAAGMKHLGSAGFNVVANTGAEAGQTVMHMHVHIIPRYAGGPEMVTWVPGEADGEENAQIAAMIKAEIQG